MKIACDKCLKVVNVGQAKDWLEVSIKNSKYILCPECEDGLWMAVDHQLPPIVKGATK